MTPRAIRQRENIERENINGRCLDCRNETTFKKGPCEYYMVHNELWARANPQVNGMLCIGCLEDLIGRRLTPDDFTDVPINNQPLNWNLKSNRLASRLAW
jgi:hypothetical protein